MSGGSYDYAYSRIEDLAERIESRDKHKVLRQRTAELLRRIAKICHDIEWIDSGDYGEEDWKDVKKQLDTIGEFNKDAAKKLVEVLKQFREDL